MDDDDEKEKHFNEGGRLATRKKKKTLLKYDTRPQSFMYLLTTTDWPKRRSSSVLQGKSPITCLHERTLRIIPAENVKLAFLH